MNKLFDGRKRKPYPVNCPLHPEDVAYPYDAYVFHGTLDAFFSNHPKLKGKFRSGLSCCSICLMYGNDEKPTGLLLETFETYSGRKSSYDQDIRYRDFKYPNYRVENT